MTMPRVYPILDTATLERRGVTLSRAAEALVQGGARILQIRHKGHWSRDLFAEAERTAALGIPLIINDRADIAMLLRAGVHLGQDDLPPGEVRDLAGPDAVLGLSTHNARQIEQSAGEPVTYLAIGPIFGTASKLNPDPVIGLDGLRQCRALTKLPLVAIGGITRDSARAVWEAGADSVAVIADICSAPDPRQRMREWLALS